MSHKYYDDQLKSSPNDVEDASFLPRDRPEAFDIQMQHSQSETRKNRFGVVALTVFVGIVCLRAALASSYMTANIQNEEPIEGSAWSSRAEPFSNVNPVSLGIQLVDRPQSSQPGEILANLIGHNAETDGPITPLPTNSWFQNLLLGDSQTTQENKIFQIPYIIDTAGFIPGVRTHPCHLQGNDRMVLVSFYFHFCVVAPCCRGTICTIHKANPNFTLQHF
jgi:hypothetical protein